MIWYQVWRETRWRFLIGLVLLLISATSTVLAYPTVRELFQVSPGADGAFARRLLAAAAVRDYRGYIWWEWFRGNLPQLWAIFAVLLGTGGLVARSARGALFMLSLPVSRRRIVLIHAAMALLQLLALAAVPSAAIVLLSPLVGETYVVRDAAIHSLSLFGGGVVIFGLAFLLSSTFTGIWRPLLIALCAVFGILMLENLVNGSGGYGLLSTMSAGRYFSEGALPWSGLAANLLAAFALLYASVRSIERRDF